MKTIYEITAEMSKLAREREILVRKEEESKYEDYFNTIITKGNVSDEQIYDFACYGKPTIIIYELFWRDSPENCPEHFVYDGYKIVDDYTEDDGRIHLYSISKENKTPFTIEELQRLIKIDGERLPKWINQLEYKIKNIKDFQKELEKTNASAK